MLPPSSIRVHTLKEVIITSSSLREIGESFDSSFSAGKLKFLEKNINYLFFTYTYSILVYYVYLPN